MRRETLPLGNIGDGRAVRRVEREQLDARTDRADLRVQLYRVFRHDRLDVGYMAGAERCQRFGCGCVGLVVPGHQNLLNVRDEG